MSTLLAIKTSILGDHGKSNQLVEQFISQWQEHNPGGQVTIRDLSEPFIPHLDMGTFMAFNTPEEARSPEQKEAVKLSDQLTDELMAADVIALGLPIYNLGVPSGFKSYIDNISRLGKTFKYTETGPVGLAKGKTVHVLAARGGYYGGSPLDSQTPYINAILAFLGIEDVQWITAEGLDISPEHKANGMQQAHNEIKALFNQEA